MTVVLLLGLIVAALSGIAYALALIADELVKIRKALNMRSGAVKHLKRIADRCEEVL